MAIIASIPIEEALSSRTRKEPSARTRRTRQLEADAAAVVQAIHQRGAAVITVDEQEDTAEHYLNGLRAALQRSGQTEVLLQKKRGQAQIIAWKARAEDAARVEARRRTGARLGQMVKERAVAVAAHAPARRGGRAQ